MLYVYCGSDTIQVRKQALECVQQLKEENNEVIFLEPEQMEISMFTDLLGSNSLFGGKNLTVFDAFSRSPEIFEALIHHSEELADSENQFVVIEEKLPAAQKKTLTKNADDFHEYLKESGEAFNPFSLTDALVARDKKKLWLLLQEARRAQISAEEIIGILFWQLKALRLAAQTRSGEEAGLKPFVYQKAKRALSTFKEGELERLSQNLVSLYHKGHRGEVDIYLALEQWVLQG